LYVYSGLLSPCITTPQVLDESLGDFEDDYLFLDCPGAVLFLFNIWSTFIFSLVRHLSRLPLPGQIELYTHMPLMRQLVEHLKERDFRVVGIYLLDAQFIGASQGHNDAPLSPI
jgi:hypothetical protein